MKDIILIVSGDPNSINSEIIYKSWRKLSDRIKKKIFFISNLELLKKQFKQLNYSVKIKKVNTFNEKFKVNELKVIDVDLNFKKPFKVLQNDASKFVISSLNKAHNLAINNRVKGIINCAIDKKLLNAGNKNLGVTEYFASKCLLKKHKEVMLIRNKRLSVSPLTTHLYVKDISKNIKEKMIIDKIIIINKWFMKTFKKKPNLAILGLNPHNGEMKKNSEEKKIILPAITKLKKKGIKINGPFVADTLFINDYKNYDIIIGMFHDQVLAPFKTLFKFDAINITLGLKYLRASPDHGTAINLIGKNKANPLSLINCINFVNKIY